MKKEFFTNLETILYQENLDEKLSNFNDFYENFKSSLFVFDMQSPSIFKSNTNKNLNLAHPTRLRRPKFATSTQALAKVVHSITHIEYSAINLALDAAYRFRNLPLQFYKDWLEVADEEIKHFKLLNQVLNELGYHYGSFSVHDNLENALKATKDNLAFRMGVVHRGLEAKGLDANPFVLEKLQSTSNPIKNFLKEALEIILNDEIKHVKKGDIWWKFSKKQDDSFLDLCKKFKDFSLAGKVLNAKARLEAGFEESELKGLESFYSKPL